MFNWSLLKLKNIYKIKKLKYTTKNIKIQKGFLGLKLLSSYTFTQNQIQSIYKLLSKNIKTFEKSLIEQKYKRNFKSFKINKFFNFKKVLNKRIFLNFNPNLAITKKPPTVRMGKGKGSKPLNVVFTQTGLILFTLTYIRKEKKKKKKKISRRKKKRALILKKNQKNLFYNKFFLFLKYLNNKNFYIDFLNLYKLNNKKANLNKYLFKIFLLFKRLFIKYKFLLKRKRKKKKKKKKKLITLNQLEFVFLDFIDMFFENIDKKTFFYIFNFKINFKKKKKVIKKHAYKNIYYKLIYNKYFYRNINNYDDQKFLEFLTSLLIEIKKKLPINSKIIKYYI